MYTSLPYKLIQYHKKPFYKTSTYQKTTTKPTKHQPFSIILPMHPSLKPQKQPF